MQENNKWIFKLNRRHDDSKNDIILDDVPKSEYQVRNVKELIKSYVKRNGKIHL